MAHRSTSRRRNKPAKPHEGFPLFAHASGRWAKKIRQRLHFFGRWGHKQGPRIVPVEDTDASARAALVEFNRQWPYLSEGLTPPPVDADEGCTVRLLCNDFLNAKRAKLASGELSQRSFSDYVKTCGLVVDQFGKQRRVDDLRPEDFERLRSSLAERLGPVSLRNEITRVRVLMKFAHDQRLIQHPVSYGQSFNKPSAKTLRRERNAGGVRMFESHELRTILDALSADPMLRAMVLLGVNAGFGNTDCASLPRSAVNLDAGWIDFPRPKTEIRRRVPLWPETVEALRAALKRRPEPKDPADANLCFLTQQGRRWVRVQKTRKEKAKAEIIAIDPLSQRFSRLLHKLGINGRRGLGFYTLRHVFQTIGGEAKDPDAVSSIMGHSDASMSAVYRERISDERLRAVTECVRSWLFG